MKTLTKIILVVSFLFSVLCSMLSVANATIPHLINYQGRLTDSSGTPLNGSYQVTFRIYDAETAGNLLWEETHSGVVIQKGIFSVLLGSVSNLDLPFDKPYFLEIKVGNEVMSPRQRITSAGYAIRAERAEEAENTEKLKTNSNDPNYGYLNEKVDNSTIEVDTANNKLKVKDLGHNFSQSGYFKFPNGLVIQWGQVNVGEPAYASFPIEFPNACFQVIISAGINSFPGERNPSAFNITKSGFYYNVGPGEAPGRWIAIGY